MVNPLDPSHLSVGHLISVSTDVKPLKLRTVGSQQPVPVQEPVLPVAESVLGPVFKVLDEHLEKNTGVVDLRLAQKLYKALNTAERQIKRGLV